MLRQAIRPLARQQPLPLTLARRSLSTTPTSSISAKALSSRAALTRPSNALPFAAAQQTPSPLAVLLAQQRLAKRQYATDAKGVDAALKQGNTTHANVDYQHTTSKAAEEVKNVVTDFAELIAGRSHAAAAAGGRENVHAHTPMSRDFLSVTKDLAQQIPPHVFNVGLLGAVPYVGTAVGTVFLAREANLASSGESTLTGIDLSTALSALHNIEAVQITYGAIILSFLGALHWGMEFAKYGGEQGYQRLAIGVVPVLLAWPTTFLTHGVALAIQWASFTGVWMLDQRASIQGWTPEWYSTYRFYLSILVGFSIIATLTGTSYYGAGSGSAQSTMPGTNKQSTAKVSSMKRLDKVAVKNHPSYGSTTGLRGTVAGDVGVANLAEEGSGEGYGKLVNKEKEAEEREQEEKEKEEKAAKQDEKEVDQAATTPPGFKSDTKARVGNDEK